MAGDAHHLPYDDATFDYVVGDGILHHLDDVALGEVHRVRKPGGRALFREPLLDSDLRQIEDSDRWNVERSYCGLLSAPVAVVTSFMLRPLPDNVFLRAANRIEQSVAGWTWLQPRHQYVLLNLVRRS
jgi:ubiquinone/menaquinone biosynthesis C-methylase UbiE